MSDSLPRELLLAGRIVASSNISIVSRGEAEVTPMTEPLNFETARNGNMIALAYFNKESRENVIELATIISRATDLIDAQTVVDTIAAVLDDLTHQYQAAQRKRDGFRK